MKRILTLGLALLMLILAGCSTEVTEYRQQQPALDIFHYFQGRTEAWGMVQDRDVVGDTLTLHERFVYDDGEKQQRVWRIRRTGDNRYQGTAGDIEGVASGQAAVLDFGALPLFEGAFALAQAYCRPSRAFSLIEQAEGYVSQGELDDAAYDDRLGVLCDPQTSGGLLVAVPPEAAGSFEQAFEARAGRRPARIGAVTDGKPGRISFSD